MVYLFTASSATTPAAITTAGLVDLANLLPLFSVWFIGNMVICAVIVPVVLRFGTPIIREHELFVKNYWS